MRFKRLLLLSRKERAAKVANLNQPITAVLGANGTGKSSLLKSIYAVFSANSDKIHPGWQNSNTELMMDFEIGQTSFTMVRKNETYGLFSAEGEVILITSSVMKELSPILANLLDFKLRMQIKKEDGLVVPPPAFCFLPFYVDQVCSWADNWTGFAKLQMMHEYKKQASYYHSGLRPNEYYEALADKLDAENCIQLIGDEKFSLEKAKTLLDHQHDRLSFDINIDQFRDRITKLTQECEKVKAQQDIVKSGISKLFSEKVLLAEQVRISQVALKELEADSNYADKLVEEEVLCPTCGTVHENNFLSRFSIVADADSCRDFIATGNAKLSEIEARIVKANERLDRISAESISIQRILTEERGQIKLQDIVDGAAERAIQHKFSSEFEKLDTRLAEHLLKLEGAKEVMRELASRKRSEEILSTFSEKISKFLALLDVHSLAETDYQTIVGKIRDTGSELPRAILAYKFAFIHTMIQHSSSPLCPIVIDSPLQQDQDDENIKRILNFIVQNTPNECQLILGSVQMHDVNFEGTVIETNQKGKLLNSEEYNFVKEQFDPFIDQMFA